MDARDGVESSRLLDASGCHIRTQYCTHNMGIEISIGREIITNGKQKHERLSFFPMRCFLCD